MHLSEMNCYPIKSCAGFSTDSWQLEPHGLRHDRTFMVVDPDGRFVTQREQPRLALIRTAISAGALHVRRPDGHTVVIDLETSMGTPITVEVWEHSGPALDQGDQSAAFFSDHLGMPCRLVRVAPEHRRAHAVAFADGYPLLLANEASLADLNDRMTEALPMPRFRPNLVVTGAPAWQEDTWRAIRIGSVEIDVVKPCARCTITTADQDTGVLAGAEPLRTLGTFRRGDRGVLFGQNCVHRAPGLLTVGDEIEVLAATGR